MGYCIYCEKCGFHYDTKYFPEFCPSCYMDDAIKDNIDDEVFILKTKFNKQQKRIDNLLEALEKYKNKENWMEIVLEGEIRDKRISDGDFVDAFLLPEDRAFMIAYEALQRDKELRGSDE